MSLRISTKCTYLTLFLLIFLFSIGTNAQQTDDFLYANQRLSCYKKLIDHKKIALVVNHTSVILKGDNAPIHLVDSLTKHNISIKAIFAPEHGFRGKQDAAEKVKDSKDLKTGIPIYSLHGKFKKPQKHQLNNIDLVLFDIQDVGVRFYTYLSTLHLVMEACAENNIPMVVLDRPNPNNHYIDGPILEKDYQSFLGKHPVPIVYGMTIGEYAQMINGEGWLKNQIQADLKIIKLKNYNRNKTVYLPVKPSPNLPSNHAILWYPTLGLFEGTIINAGRGTLKPFEKFGAPWFPEDEFKYTPIKRPGAQYPKHLNKTCYGFDLSAQKAPNKIDLKYLVQAYRYSIDKKFFGSTFNLHAGNSTLQKQIINEVKIKDIEKEWKEGIKQFKEIRKKYLLYP